MRVYVPLETLATASYNQAMSTETQELIRICESLPEDKRRGRRFARFLLAREDEERWERLIAFGHAGPSSMPLASIRRRTLNVDGHGSPLKSLTRPSFWRAYDALDPRVRRLQGRLTPGLPKTRAILRYVSRSSPAMSRSGRCGSTSNSARSASAMAIPLSGSGSVPTTTSRRSSALTMPERPCEIFTFFAVNGPKRSNRQQGRVRAGRRSARRGFRDGRAGEGRVLRQIRERAKT